MDGLILEWLNLAFRWFHVVAGIAWIGASFYFIWLDLSLREPPQWKADQGVKGDLWAIHGGGIYEVAKYNLRPEVMPGKLHWFKWEAYSTWLSGTGLLIVMYYVQAQSYLVGHDTWIQSPGLAIASSVAFIVVGQVCYEFLIRTPLVRKSLVFAASLLVLITLASWLAHHLFSARAAYLHVGAMIATWMAGNVFWGIMPAQRKFVAAVSANQEPDMDIALFAKLRSTHNNYLTLPVIFCMISNHYPFIYGHAHSWLALVAIGALLAWGRHFFNLKHRDIIKPGILISAALGMILVAVIMAHTNYKFSATPEYPASENFSADESTELSTEGKKIHQTQQVLQLVSVHCMNCHATAPRQSGFTAPPGGLVIENLEQLTQHKMRAMPAIQSGYMPLGNFTQLTDDERQLILSWLAEQ
jgi:uncharacterized membrane protein